MGVSIQPVFSIDLSDSESKKADELNGQPAKAMQQPNDETIVKLSA